MTVSQNVHQPAGAAYIQHLPEGGLRSKWQWIHEISAATGNNVAETWFFSKLLWESVPDLRIVLRTSCTHRDIAVFEAVFSVFLWNAHVGDALQKNCNFLYLASIPEHSPR